MFPRQGGPVERRYKRWGGSLAVDLTIRRELILLQVAWENSHHLFAGDQSGSIHFGLGWRRPLHYGWCGQAASQSAANRPGCLAAPESIGAVAHFAERAQPFGARHHLAYSSTQVSGWSGCRHQTAARRPESRAVLPRASRLGRRLRCSGVYRSPPDVSQAQMIRQPPSPYPRLADHWPWDSSGPQVRKRVKPAPRSW